MDLEENCHVALGVAMLHLCVWDGHEGWSRLEQLRPLLLFLPVLFENGTTRLEHIARTMCLYFASS